MGHGVAFYAIQLITTGLMALAVNTSFGGLPVLASLLARDNLPPHLFALKGERQVFRYGVGVLAAAAAVLLVVAKGSTQALIPVFAIGVFVGISLFQAGMVKHWREQPGRAGAGARSSTGAARCSPGRAGDRGDKQVSRGRVAGGHHHPGAGAGVHPDPPGVQRDRRPA